MSAATVEKLPNQITVFRHELNAMQDQFAAALPAHIPAERFARVVMTAIQNNPKLLNCTRQSLWNACMKAAQDGLLPDGREGAIVPYGENEEGNKKSDIAQWMPMILGIRKKARNSGEIAGWEAQCVYANDEFEFELGDEPFIRHRPALNDRGAIIAAYSIATLKDGYKSREVMSIKEIEGIRSKSKAKKGPWGDPIFYPEMCKKVVARRHAKVLPMSTDLDDLIRRDDPLYDLEGARDDAQAARPRSIASKLDALAALPDSKGKTIEADPASHSGTQDDAPGATENAADAAGHGTASQQPDAGTSTPEPSQAKRGTKAKPAPKQGPFDSATWAERCMKALRAADSAAEVDKIDAEEITPRKGDASPLDWNDVADVLREIRETEAG